MKTEVVLVKGYHEVTAAPDLALAENLRYRFAVLLDTYNPDLDFMYFPLDLFFAVLCEVSNVVDHDGVLIELDKNTTFYSFKELHDHLEKRGEQFLDPDEDDREPPYRVHLLKFGELTCLMETEFWCQCGGPQPYSDSYTASFYTKENLDIEFEKACAAACQRAGGVITQMIEASPEPVRVPWWKRLLWRLR